LSAPFTPTFDARAKQALQSVASVPRIFVTWLDSTPPLPWHSATCAFSTCRAPHSPRNWRTASTSVNIPYMPGCVQDRPPPFVLTVRDQRRATEPQTDSVSQSYFLQKLRC